MAKRAWVAFLALALLGAPGAWGQTGEHHDIEVIEPPPRPLPKQKADLEKVAKGIVERTNAFRKEQERSPVTVSPKLTAAARYFAGYMAANDRFGHTADGNRPGDRAKKHGYDYCIVLENIAYEYDPQDFETNDLAARFVKAWEESPGHRRNMLDPDVTQTGVAVARSQKSGYYYAVQMFGRPHSQAITFRIANRAGAEVQYTIAGRKFRLGERYIRTHMLCRPAAVQVRLPGEKAAKTLRPANGDRFTVTRDGDRVVVRKE